MGYYDSYLEHHGILGMKWGKKSGPPYPLSAQTHNAVTSQASDAERKAAAERGGGSAASLNTQNSGNLDKEKAKKIAKGVAIGAGVAAGVALVAHPTTRALLLKYGGLSLKKGGEIAIRNAKQVPDAMVKGALAAVGMITMNKVLKKLDPPENATQTQKDASEIAKGAARAGINKMFNTNYSDNKQKGSGVVGSKEYNQLFDGLSKEDPIRAKIKTAARNGSTIEELRRIRNGEVIHSSVIDWSKSFKYYG